MKKILLILVFLSLMSSLFGQNIKRDTIIAKKDMECQLKFVYRDSTIDFFTMTESRFCSIDSGDYHKYPISGDNFMKVFKYGYDTLTFSTWEAVLDTLSYYLANTIDTADTTWWGRAETDPIYSIDSTYIVWFNDLIGIRDSLQHALDSIKIINDSLLIFSNKISIINADTALWSSLTANDTIIKVVTPTQLYNYLDTVGIEKNTYSITLPYSTTVTGRIALAVEGTDYPTGWVLEGDGLNLVVTHNLGRSSSNVTVMANTSGTIWQQQRNTAAYIYYADLSSNTVEVFSLCTATKPIKVIISFLSE